MDDTMEEEGKAAHTAEEKQDLTNSPDVTQPDCARDVVTDLLDQSDLSPDPVLSERPLPSRPVPLTFRNTKGKDVPLGYVGIHEVLDCLGRVEHPNAWGLLPGWSLMPFRTQRGVKGFFQPHVQREKYEAKLKHDRLDTAHLESELRSCTKLYVKIRKKLSLALQAEKLHACILWPDSGKIEQILEPGVWITQRTTIFYTGLMPRWTDGRGVRHCRVLFKQAEFTKWLEGVKAEHRRVTRRATLKQICDCLGRIAKKGGYPLHRAPTWNLVRGILTTNGQGISKSEFNSQIWGDLVSRSGAGKPTKKHRAAFDHDLHQLTSEIKAIIQRSERLVKPAIEKSRPSA